MYKERISLPESQQKVLEKWISSCKGDCSRCELRSACETLYCRFPVSNYFNPVDVTGGDPTPERLPTLFSPTGRKVPHLAGW